MDVENFANKDAEMDEEKIDRFKQEIASANMKIDKSNSSILKVKKDENDGHEWW